MKHKLLVAEDIAAERSALISTLQTNLGDSISIIEAKDGSEALTLYMSETPEILILNIEMPVLTGLEVAQKIREQDKSCAILFISDFDNFSYAKQAIALRALDYILKPYDANKLIFSVQEAIHHISHLNPSARDRKNFHPQECPNSIRLSMVREDINSFIQAHYMEELSMKIVARAMNYSDAYFCKLFKQCFHVNFSTYLNEFRIEKAKDLIKNPRINVKDIGLACGYTDSNYFTRVFKRVTGQTPTEYRLAIMEKMLLN